MKIKIMIVDDSIVVRAMLKQVLDKRPHDYELIASAKDGRDALYHLKTKEIDVVIMDVEMPRMNGIEALKEIMETNPKPVIMFSSLTGRDTKETIEALKLGAMDFIQKPMKHVEFITMQEQLHEKIQIAYKAKEKIKRREKTENKKEIKKIEKTKNKQNRNNDKVEKIALIGCSTGGPKALHEVLGQIERDLDGSIVVVQHMPVGNYTKMLAEHLNNHAYLEVKEARNGEEIMKGCVYIGKAGNHLLIRQNEDKLYIEMKEKSEKKNGHCPSVDELINSAKELNEIDIVVAILTGMGADGSESAKSLSEKNEKVIFIGESEETSVVYGMPKQLKLKVPKTEEYPLYKIGKEIEKKINQIKD